MDLHGGLVVDDILFIIKGSYSIKLGSTLSWIENSFSENYYKKHNKEYNSTKLMRSNCLNRESFLLPSKDFKFYIWDYARSRHPQNKIISILLLSSLSKIVGRYWLLKKVNLFIRDKKNLPWKSILESRKGTTKIYNIIIKIVNQNNQNSWDRKFQKNKFFCKIIKKLSREDHWQLLIQLNNLMKNHNRNNKLLSKFIRSQTQGSIENIVVKNHLLRKNQLIQSTYLQMRKKDKTKVK